MCVHMISGFVQQKIKQYRMNFLHTLQLLSFAKHIHKIYIHSYTDIELNYEFISHSNLCDLEINAPLKLV